MLQKTLNLTVGILLAIVSIAHLFRSIFEWPVYIGTFFFPVGLSVIAFLVTGFIAYSAFKLNSKNSDTQNIKY